MKKIPKEDRLKFYQFLNASATFDQVSNICHYIKKNHIDQSHILFYPLVLSLAVIYARPFKQRKNIRIPTLIIGKEYQDTHDFLILLRDKVFAHTDTDGPRYDKNTSINQLYLEAQNGQVKAHLTTLGIRNTEIERIRQHSINKFSKEMCISC